MNLKWKQISRQLWPYLLILAITLIYFLYLLSDSRYFFYDDFTALKFVAERSYWQVISDSLFDRNIDRHKFLGYLVHKALFDTVGVKLEIYFLLLWLIHTLNSWLVFRLLKRLTGQTLVSALLSSIFAYRFYLWWFSNIHTYLAAFFCLWFTHIWLDYLRQPEKGKLLSLWLLWPLAVFAYGPSVFWPLALILITVIKKGSIAKAKPLFPFALLFLIYLPVFVLTADSLNRFTSGSNPYTSDFSLSTYFTTQAIYLSELGNKLFPISVPFTVLIWGGLALLAWRYDRKTLVWLLGFFIALAGNSFFASHTMYYYLYLPIVLVFIFFAQMFKTKLWPIALVIFMVLLAPWSGLKQLVFRLRHPSVNFEQRAMVKIATVLDQAVATGQREVKLSNWEVTPNLEHAIVYQAIPYFMTHPERFQLIYGYSRQTEIVSLTLKQR